MFQIDNCYITWYNSGRFCPGIILHGGDPPMELYLKGTETLLSGYLPISHSTEPVFVTDENEVK